MVAHPFPELPPKDAGPAFRRTLKQLRGLLG
jgi:hypothetical protein